MMRNDLFLFAENLIFLNDTSENANMLFETIGEKIKKKGYVRESFVEALKKREEEYPTGLRTDPYEIAIPHVDEFHVNKEAIIVVRPQRAIRFREMATFEQYVEAKLIFILLLKKENKHAECLEVLLEMAQQEAFMAGMLHVENEKKAYQLIKQYFDAH